MTKGGAGKRKGSAFERKVCEKLSRWIQPNTEETLFWRSAMSGGRATVRHARGKKDDTQSGDISCIHPEGAWLTEHFAIECKFYADLDIKSALLKNKGKLAKFWKEIRKVAKKHGKHPMLIAKENRTDTLLLINEEGYTSLNTFRPMGNISYLVRSPLMKTRVYDFEEVMKS